MSTTSYHHGNLRAELLGIAMRRCREHGASALVLRDLAREAGVTPAAVYRHFATVDHLQAEVARLARQELAAAMIAAKGEVRNGRHAAIRRFEATGRAYIRFAIDEPGWFGVAFASCAAPPEQPDDPAAWSVLNDALDELVRSGAMAAGMRAVAPLIAWSSVHGLGSLFLGHQIEVIELVADDLVDGVIAGVLRALEVSRQPTSG